MFGLCQETTKIQCIHLALKKVKLISKKCQVRYEWRFWRLNSKKIGATHVILSLTEKSSRNNIFKSKQAINNVALNAFKGFKVKKKVRLMFWRLKGAAWKVNIMFLAAINKEIRCSRGIHNVNCKKISISHAFWC